MKKDNMGRRVEKLAAKCGMSSSKLLAASLLAVFLISASYVLVFGTPSIVYVAPITANNTNTSNNWVYVNITSTENLNISIVQWGNQSGFVNVTMSNISASMTNWYINMSGLADRTYNYTILAQNTTGAWNQTAMQFVTVDTTKPVLFGIGPNNSVVSNKQNLSLNISATDGAGVGLAACIVNVGGNPNTTLAASSGWCNMTGISMANLALGAAPINIWINDSVGNTLYNNSYTVTIGGNVIPGGTQWNATVPVSLNMSAGDMFFGDGDNVSIIANFTTNIQGITYPYDNLTIQANTTAIGGASPTIAPLGNGIYRITAPVNITNVTGGVSQFSGAPVILLVWNASSPVGPPINFGQPLMAMAVLVNMSTIPGCPPDPSQVPPAIFWNGSMKNVSGCVVSGNAPCIGLDTPIYYNATTNNVTLCGPVFGPATTNFTDIAKNGNFSAVPLVIDVPGKAKINFSAVDMGDQQKSSAIMQFAMKNLMAKGQFGINESEWNGQGGKPNLTMSATLTLYNVSGLFGNSQYYSISYGSFNGMNAPNSTSLCPPSRCSGFSYVNGNLTFTVSSFSSYIIGGVNYTINFANTTSILQSVNPGVNATYLINISNLGNNTNAVTYNLSVQGPGSLNASQITLNSTAMGGTTWAVVQLNVSNATPGTYYSNITAVASDNSSAVFVSLGNGLASPITTTVLDITNPQVLNTTSASGNPGAVVQISNVNVTDNVNVAQVFVNLTPLGNNTLAPMTLVAGNNVSGNYSANITIPYGTLGNYPLLIRANDTGGNVNATQTILLTVNNVPPVVSVNYPTSGFIKGTVTVNATVTDNNGNNTITNVTFYYNNGTYNFIGWQNVSQGNAVYNVSWNTASLNLANYTIFVNATDGANWGNATGSSFVVHNAAPQFSAISVSTGSIYAGSFNFSVTITEPYFASASYSIVNATNSSIVWTSNATATTANGTFNSIVFDGIYLPAGNWTINVSATDLAGNVNSTAANITSYTAIRAPSTYDARVQGPGAIGSGTPGIYNFTIYAKGYPYVRMYLNLTNGGYKFQTAGSINNAALSNGTANITIDDNGAYSNANTVIVAGISAGALPAYATGSITGGLYKQVLQLYLYPYSGLSAGTYSGNYGFAVSQTY